MADAPVLRGLRRGIDLADDVLLATLAARRGLVILTAAHKRAIGQQPRDPVREQRIHARAQRLARRVGLPADTARAAMALAVADGCRLQGLADDLDQGGDTASARMLRDVNTAPPSPETSYPWLRWWPSPARWAPLLRAISPHVQRRLLETSMARALSVPLAAGEMDFLSGRRLGIDVTDLDLHWVVELRDGRLCATSAAPEASVRGTATDLLLLAARLEDADTLFFQRRLVMTGDTELGLTARNVLDRLSWAQVPLDLRIGLNRAARLARAARAAHQAA